MKPELIMQLHYNVDYELNGEKLTETQIWSSDPGSAMAHVLKQNPEARIIRAWKEGVGFGIGFQEWQAPPVQRQLKPEPKPARALKPNERGCEFHFYDEVVGIKS